MLTVTDLSIARGGVPVLARLSFAVAPGEVVMVRGPNGIGKTTLLRTIAGLQPPLSGTVETAPHAVAYGAHADGLKAMLSVTENLAFWAAIYGTTDLEPALQQFDLVGLRDRLAHGLSAGQKRRLGLARLMVTGRPLWVLDEPTVSLDQASVARFAEAVAQHVAQGGAALIASHIDIGLPARVLDVSPYRAAAHHVASDFDEAFL